MKIPKYLAIKNRWLMAMEPAVRGVFGIFAVLVYNIDGKKSNFQNCQTILVWLVQWTRLDLLCIF